MPRQAAHQTFAKGSFTPPLGMPSGSPAAPDQAAHGVPKQGDAGQPGVLRHHRPDLLGQPLAAHVDALKRLGVWWG